MSSCLTLYPSRQSPPSASGRSSAELSCIGIDPTTGNEMPDTQWMSGWSPSCISTFQNLINSGGSSGLYGFSPSGLTQSQADFQYMWSKLLNSNSGYALTIPGQNGFNGFQTVLLDACIAIPGACDTAQTKMCANCSRSQISSSQPLLTLCGCFAPSLQSVYGSQYGNITPECDPLCSQQLAAKQVDPTTGAIQECQATICVIDNVSIGASNSSTGGSSFTQVCPSCTDGQGQCKCIVNVTNPNILGSISSDDQGLDDSSTFYQYCPNALCLATDQTTQTVNVVPCQNYVTTTATVPTFTKSIPIGVWILAIIIIVILVLVILSVKCQGDHILVFDPLAWKPNPSLAYMPPAKGQVHGRMKTSMDF